MKKLLTLVFSLFFVLSVKAQYVQTPNIGLQIPANGSTNWNLPLNYNFNAIDQMLGGITPIPGLRITGNLTVGGSITAGSYIGPGGSTFAFTTTANRYSAPYYSGTTPTTTLSGVSINGLAFYSSLAVPRAALATDIASIFSPLTTGCYLSGDGTCSMPSGSGAPLNNPTGGQNNYAPLNGANFTGTPTAPTAPYGYANTQIATTQFVQTAITDTVDSLTYAGTLTFTNAARVTDVAISGNVTSSTMDPGAFDTQKKCIWWSNSSSSVFTVSYPTNWQGSVTPRPNGTTLVCAYWQSAASEWVVPNGTMATQNANAVAITGGTIDGTTLGPAVVATTQTVGDNSTKVATTAFVLANAGTGGGASFFANAIQFATSTTAARAATASDFSTVLQTASGCTTAGNVYVPQSNTCITPGGSMVYPGAGIPISTGSAWGTSLPAPPGGTTNFLRADGTWAVPAGGSSLTLTTSGTSGAATYSSPTLNIPQYQGQITLTTTGSSGAATLSGNTLNIPNYAGGSGGAYASLAPSATQNIVNPAGVFTENDGAPLLTTASNATAGSPGILGVTGYTGWTGGQAYGDSITAGREATGTQYAYASLIAQDTDVYTSPTYYNRGVSGYNMDQIVDQEIFQYANPGASPTYWTTLMGGTNFSYDRHDYQLAHMAGITWLAIPSSAKYTGTSFGSLPSGWSLDTHYPVVTGVTSSTNGASINFPITTTSSGTYQTIYIWYRNESSNPGEFIWSLAGINSGAATTQNDGNTNTVGVIPVVVQSGSPYTGNLTITDITSTGSVSILGVGISPVISNPLDTTYPKVWVAQIPRYYQDGAATVGTQLATSSYDWYAAQDVNELQQQNLLNVGLVNTSSFWPSDPASTDSTGQHPINLGHSELRTAFETPTVLAGYQHDIVVNGVTCNIYQSCILQTYANGQNQVGGTTYTLRCNTDITTPGANGQIIDTYLLFYAGATSTMTGNAACTNGQHLWVISQGATPVIIPTGGGPFVLPAGQSVDLLVDGQYFKCASCNTIAGGTMALQNANAIDGTGGTLDNVSIGTSTQSTGRFNSLSSQTYSQLEAASVTAASTITPGYNLFHLTGTTTVNVMTPLALMGTTVGAGNYGGEIYFIADAITPFAAGSSFGSFQSAFTTIPTHRYHCVLTPSTGLWYCANSPFFVEAPSVASAATIACASFPGPAHITGTTAITTITPCPGMTTTVTASGGIGGFINFIPESSVVFTAGTGIGSINATFATAALQPASCIYFPSYGQWFCSNGFIGGSQGGSSE